MGMCTSNSNVRVVRTHTAVVNPDGDDHAAIELEYASLLNHDNDQNLNLKYNYLYTLDPTTTVGKGIKKTVGFKAKTDKAGILKKRKEFWGRNY
jgi:hypothetical protein